MKTIILYKCDGRKCENCFELCEHTSDPMYSQPPAKLPRTYKHIYVPEEDKLYYIEQ